MENKFTRCSRFRAKEWLGYGSTSNHFQIGGGLNLGYTGYLAPDINSNGEVVSTYSGTSGASVSARLEFQNLLRINNFFNLPLKTYLFAMQVL